MVDDLHSHFTGRYLPYGVWSERQLCGTHDGCTSTNRYSGYDLCAESAGSAHFSSSFLLRLLVRNAREFSRLTPLLPFTFPLAKHCSLNFFPACKNSSLSRVPATAWDKESPPYIKTSRATAFSRLSLPASIIWANDLIKLDNSFSRALRYGSPARATSAAAPGSRQPASLQSRCRRDRY